MTAKNTWEYIYQTLQDEILSMRLLPGQMVGEIDTAKRFEVSRTPVRDALKKLSQDGLLEIIPQKGSFVTKINLKGIIDLVYIREKVELAVLNEISGKLSEDSILKLKLSMSEQREIAEACDVSMDAARKFIEADNEFHSILFAAAGKQSIWKIVSGLGPDYNRVRILINRNNNEVIKILCENHFEIFSCLLRQDNVRLFEIYSNHIYKGLSSIDEIYEKNSEYFTKE